MRTAVNSPGSLIALATELAFVANLWLGAACIGLSVPPPPPPADCVKFLIGADQSQAVMDVSDCHLSEAAVRITQQRTGIVVDVTTDQAGNPDSRPEFQVQTGDLFQLRYGDGDYPQQFCVRFASLGPASAC